MLSGSTALRVGYANVSNSQYAGPTRKAELRDFGFDCTFMQEGANPHTRSLSNGGPRCVPGDTKNYTFSHDRSHVIHTNQDTRVVGRFFTSTAVYIQDGGIEQGDVSKLRVHGILTGSNPMKVCNECAVDPRAASGATHSASGTHRTSALTCGSRPAGVAPCACGRHGGVHNSATSCVACMCLCSRARSSLPSYGTDD